MPRSPSETIYSSKVSPLSNDFSIPLPSVLKFLVTLGLVECVGGEGGGWAMGKHVSGEHGGGGRVLGIMGSEDKCTAVL